MTASRCHVCFNQLAHCTCAADRARQLRAERAAAETDALRSAALAMDPFELLRRLMAIDDPRTYDSDWGWNDCQWCDLGGYGDEHDGLDHEHEHAADCPWLLTMVLLGLDLGKHHLASPAQVEAG